MSTWLAEQADDARRVDLRLVPAAVGVWVTTAAGTAPVTWPLWGLTALGLGIAVGAGIGRSQGTRWAAGTALAGLVLVCTAVLALVRQADRLGSPLLAAAEVSGDVTVQVTVTTDPEPLRAGPGGPRVLVEVAVRRLVVAGPRGPTAYRLDRPAVLLAPAAGWTGVLPGQSVRLRGTAMPSLTGDADAAIAQRGPPTLLAPASTVQAAAGTVRSALSASAHRAVGPPAAGLLVALVDGDTRDVDPVTDAEFTAAGLTHLLAVSGANCAILTGALLWLARRLRLPLPAQLVLTAAGLVAFVVVARPSPSVLRAAAMGVVTLVALASGRSRAAVPALAGAVLVLLLVSPGLAVSAGFALSVVATAGIVVLAPQWTRRLRAGHGRWPGLPLPLAASVAVAAAAGVVTAPVLVLLQPTVNLVSLPANLLAAPVVPVATVLGVVAAVFGPWWPGAADLACWVAGFAVRWLVVVAHVAAGVPEARLPWPAGVLGSLLLVAALAAVAVAVRVMGRRRALRVLAAGLVVGVVVVGVPVRTTLRAWPPDGWRLVMCDVGQGDAFAIRAGPAEAVVVDVGPDPVAVDGCLRRLGVTRVPLLVLSHLHQDHVGGLTGVIGRRPVGLVLSAVGGATPEQVDRLRRTAARYGAPVVAPVVGDQRRVGDVVVTVVGPLTPQRGTRSDLNNNSLVLRVDVAGLSVLMPGDAEVEEQQEFLADPGLKALLHVDVLKVPHHGSAYQQAEFLASTGARVGLVSVGAGNDYGHPSPLTMAVLARDGMRVWRTDLSGDVAIVGVGADLGVVVRPTEEVPP